MASKVCDDKSSNTYYQSVDHLGSTNVLTDDKGEFYEHIETFPDGSIWVKEYVDQSGVNATYTNYEMDVETKLFYAWARYYDAQLGKFISTDPAMQHTNLYMYCRNNPLSYIDPTGMVDCRTNEEAQNRKYYGDNAPHNNLYNSEARNKEINNIVGNQRGFEKGINNWDGSSNYSLVPLDPKNTGDGYWNVSRSVGNGRISVNGFQYNTKEQADSIKKKCNGYSITYCNFVASHIAGAYNASNLQNFKGTEHNANNIFDNLKNGYYNTNSGSYMPVSWDEAEDYASKGGFAIASWKNPNPRKSGHIVVITGGYAGDKSLGNLNIFQAGGYNKFGYNKFSKGFGRSKWSSIDFYIWRER